MNKKPKNSSTLRALFVIACLLSIPLATSAQSKQPPERKPDLFAKEHRQALQTSPEGVTFTIRLQGGQKRFRQGEIIKVELEFSGPPSTPYSANTAAYDRSGRLSIDTYHLDPQDGVSDPLYDYYSSGAFFGGGLSSIHRLAQKPFRIVQEVNEWYRFDKPGAYRLYVTSKRIGKERAPGIMSFTPDDQTTVTSNIVEFEIVPAEPLWAKQTLQNALQIIDISDYRQGSGDKDEARRAACRVLRFLGTEAAAKEMIRRIRGRDNLCDYEYNFGLIGSPHRTFVIREMERQFTIPDQPILSFFLHTLSLLAQPKIPQPPDANGDPEISKQREVWAQKQRDAFNEKRVGYIERLGAAVSLKTGVARAISLNTLLEALASIPRAARTPAMARQWDDLATQIPAVMSDLPPEMQYGLLNWRWKRLNNPAMLPVIRRLYEKAATAEIREIALQRLYQLSPEEGRRLILEEIHRQHPRINAKTLGLLPETTLPELDEFLAGRLERAESESEFNDLEIHSALLARYATASILPRIRAVYEPKIGQLACAIQTSLLAYFLRVDPEYGSRMVKKALAVRKETGCYQSGLRELADTYWCPELEAIAIDYLNDPEPAMISQAAAALSQQGSPAAKESLWNRFEQWHQTWDGRAEELGEQEGVDVMASPAHVELELVRALASARMWVLSAEEAGKLVELCVTRMGRREAEDLGWTRPGSVPLPITVYFSSEGDEISSISVAQHEFSSLAELQEKLSQYPSGMAFTWTAVNGGDAIEMQTFLELKQYLEKSGKTLRQ